MRKKKREIYDDDYDIFSDDYADDDDDYYADDDYDDDYDELDYDDYEDTDYDYDDDDDYYDDKYSDSDYDDFYEDEDVDDFERVPSKNSRSKSKSKFSFDLKKFLKYASITLILFILFIFVLILSYIIYSNYFLKDSTVTDVAVVEEFVEDESDSTDSDEPVIDSDDEILNKSSVYPDDLSGNSLLHLGLVNDLGLVIPVSLLIPNEKVISDFEILSPSDISYLDLYNKYSLSLDLESLGFSNYHPYVGNLTNGYLPFDRESNSYSLSAGLKSYKDSCGSDCLNVLIFEMSSESANLYDVSDSSVSIFLNSLVDTFYGSYDEIHFYDSSGSVYNFVNGDIGSKVVLDESKNNYIYGLHELSNGNLFFSSNFGKTYSSDTVLEVFELLKSNLSDSHSSIVPRDFVYDLSLENDTLIFNFVDGIDFNDYDSQSVLGFIEGILLSATSFDLSVRFDNVDSVYWKGFDFSSVLSKPVGANKIVVN